MIFFIIIIIIIIIIRKFWHFQWWRSINIFAFVYLFWS